MCKFFNKFAISRHVRLLQYMGLSIARGSCGRNTMRPWQFVHWGNKSLQLPQQKYIDWKYKRKLKETYLLITFSHNHQICLSIYLYAGSICLTRFGKNHIPLRDFSAAIFTSLTEENQFQISTSFNFWNKKW